MKAGFCFATAFYRYLLDSDTKCHSAPHRRRVPPHWRHSPSHCLHLKVLQISRFSCLVFSSATGVNFMFRKDNRLPCSSFWMYLQKLNHCYKYKHFSFPLNFRLFYFFIKNYSVGHTLFSSKRNRF